MSRQSFAEKMNNAKLMLVAVKQNSERLGRRGLDEAFVTNFEQVYSNTQTLDSDQEKLKAELKTKTEALQTKVSDLEALYSEAKKILKIEMEKSLWIEFGIGDKR